MAVPTANTWADGDSLDSTSLNTGIRDPAKYLLQDRPLCQVHQAVTQSPANSTWTSITFTVEDVDTHDGHSTVTNTAEYVIPEDGWYQLSGTVAFSSNATGARGSRWVKNGSALTASQSLIPAVSGQNTSVPAKVLLVSCVAGDIIVLQGWQNSGAGLATIVSGEATSGMTIVYVRKL